MRRTIQIAAGGLLLGCLAWQQVQATRIGYEVERARRESRRLQVRLALLRVEIERSLSLAGLASQARGRLGMFPASPESVRLLPAEEASPVTAGPRTNVGSPGRSPRA